MLLDLEIKNGTLSPKFDKYVNTYSVNVEKDVNSLVLEYKLEEGYSLEIINNDVINPGDNIVYLEVKKDKEVNIYTLEVYKETEKAVINYDNYLEALEVDAPMPKYVPPLIIGGCILLILLSYFIIFHKKKKH